MKLLILFFVFETLSLLIVGIILYKLGYKNGYADSFISSVCSDQYVFKSNIAEKNLNRALSEIEKQNIYDEVLQEGRSIKAHWDTLNFIQKINYTVVPFGQ